MGKFKMGKFSVDFSTVVDGHYDFVSENEKQYLQGIGAIETVEYNEPIYRQLPNGEVIAIYIDNVGVVHMEVTEVDVE